MSLITPDSLSAWDSSTATLKRIDELLVEARMYHMQDNIDGYYKTLRNLRKEIIVKMRHYKIEKKCLSDCIACIDDKLWSKIERNYTLFGCGNNNFIFIRKLMKDLDNYEIHLRNFMDLKQMLLHDKMEKLIL